jgi:ferric-dicitrate binding protein FerR (iron transport regulator)
METNKNIEYWDLIAKYYSDECTQNEIDDLLKWKNEDIDNQILFDQVKQDLEIINLNKSMNKINVDSAWEKLRNRIQEDEQKMPIIEEKKSRLIAFPHILKYAAAIILLVSIGFFSTKVYQKISDNAMLEIVSINDQGKEVILPDGSIVLLNANSKISYPNTFAANERRVKLEGEAFFDVTKNQDKPFIIEAMDAEVKVLGTSFNVNANIPGHKIEVFVETGLVQLSSKRNDEQRIIINPGSVGVLGPDKITKEINNNKNLVSWKTKEIVFYEDSMKYVIETLNRVYNTNIQCENQDILNSKYTSTFEDQEIDSILHVICFSMDFKMENKENGIYLIKYGS